jgi:hypothetical protein
MNRTPFYEKLLFVVYWIPNKQQIILLKVIRVFSLEDGNRYVVKE